VASKTERFHVQLVELRFQRQLDVATGATEMVNAERFVQRCHHVSCDRTVADEAYVTEQLIEVGFAVGEAILFIISVAVKWLLAFRTTEMVDVKLLAKGVYDPLVFDGLLASSADGDDAHFVVAS